MTENEKYLKYKINYGNQEKGINFYSIDSILNNLGSYYKIIKQQYELHSGGGSYQESSTSSPRTSKEKKYYKKYKNLIKSSAQSINYYKNLIQLQMSNQMKLNNYYLNLVGLLRGQRDRLASGYHMLGNDIKNEKEKIGMLETMITGLEKYIQSSKDLEVNVKKITLKGGAPGGQVEPMDFSQFQDAVLIDMNGLATHIDDIESDKKFLESKITELHKRMTDIVTQNDQLFKIKAEIEWMVNQMENVGGEEKKEQDFQELYGKIQGMILEAKSKGTISKSISDYIHKLEEYAAYLENFIKTNDKTLGLIKPEMKAPKKEAVAQRAAIEEGVKTIATNLTKKDDGSGSSGPSIPPGDGSGGVAVLASQPISSSTVVTPPVQSGNVSQPISSSTVVNPSSSSTVVTPPVQSGNVSQPISSSTVVTPPPKSGKGSSSSSTVEKPPLRTQLSTVPLGTSDINKTNKSVTPKVGSDETQSSKPKSSTASAGKRRFVQEGGAGNFAQLIGGGEFMDEYNKRSDTMIEKLTKVIQNNFDNVEIEGKDFIVDSLKDKTGGGFPIYFGKLATMSGLLIKLNKMLETYNQLYGFLEKNGYIDFLKHDDVNSRDLVVAWKEIFKEKKTDFYADVILKYDIYFYNYSPLTNKTISFENALKNLEKPDPASKIIIKIEDTMTFKSDIDKMLEYLDNTVVAMDHLIFFIENLTLTALKIIQSSITDTTQSQEIADSIKSLEDVLKAKKNSLMKSAFLNTSTVYSVLYGSTTQAGGAGEIILPSVQLPTLTKEDKDMYFELFKLYTSSSLGASDKNPMTATNQKQVEKTRDLTTMMIGLYDKINLKLGSTDDRTLFAALTEEQKQIKKFSDFENLIKKLETESGPITVETKDESGQVTISKVSKPRLDIYKNRLIKCREELKPYMKNIAILRNLLGLSKEGNFPMEETLKLISLYNNVKRQIEDGINSYIKLIPMIFFTIEFPPSVYANQKCKYRFTFNAKKEMVEYKFIDGQDKTECNKLGLGDFAEEEFNGSEFNSHAAFFESNKLNGTKKLIDDPVIGLGKLIKTDSDATKPINSTINMMFALGASGTGKTTRYFGKSNGHPDDKEGIVPYIINKSIEDAKTADPTAPPTKEISIAYFVCYGQKTQVNSTDAGFNELVIFFNINEIEKSNKGDSTVSNDSKYIPFYMPKSATPIPDQNVNKYTQFYSTVVSKKLDKRTYSELKGFITDGEDFPKSLPKHNDQDLKTFREVVGKKAKYGKTKDEVIYEDVTPEIWRTIKPEESSKIGDLFENLIIEQKKINTVLPTKNNIESSRGHTCVLVRIVDKLATTNNVKYFPLFDMAGTENTGQINVFLKDGRNTDKMAKLVQKVNTVTQKADILRADDETKQYPSLNDLLKYENISNWVNTKNKYLTINSIGGGKERIKVDDFYNTELQNNKDPSPGEKFLNKVVKEGYYINHTISMLIFAAMCVGSSLRTELITTDAGTTEDKFDDFFDSLFSEIDKFTCVPSATGDTDCPGKTMMLLSKKNSGAIVNSSCIWLQILFSFLYWNEETPSSIKNWLDKLNSKTNSSIEYLCEPEFKSTEFIPGLLSVDQLLKLGPINDEFASYQKIYELMENVNKSEQFTSVATRKLGGPVTLVTVDNKGKALIESSSPGSAQASVPTDRTVEIDNPTFDRTKLDNYKKAFEIRKAMGISEKDAKKAYVAPVDPGTFDEPEPTKAADKKSWANKQRAHATKVTSYEQANKVYEDRMALLNEAQKQTYQNKGIQEATEYLVPEKIKVNLKVYFDFLENATKIGELNAFKTKLDAFLKKYTEPSEFEKNIKLKTGMTTAQSIKDLHEKTDDIITESKKFFATPMVVSSQSKTKTKSGSASTPAVSRELVLVEKIEHTYPSKTDRITSYASLDVGKKNNLKLDIFENMLADIELILDDFETKKLEDDKLRSGFKPSKDVIADLKTISTMPIPSTEKLLKLTGAKLQKDSAENKFVIVNSSGAVIGPVSDIMKRIQDLPPNLPTCDPANENKIIAENQINRIKDGRAAATKMTLMHLVTGQGVKHYMVGETIKLCKTLYDSTNLDLSGK